MTLIEIMVVVAIIGLMMGAVAVVAWEKFQQARIKTTRMALQNISSQLTSHLLDKPTPCVRSLQQLHKEGVLTDPPMDHWGNPFGYRCPALHSKAPADLWSNGPDGKEGTADDILSWRQKPH